MTYRTTLFLAAGTAAFLSAAPSLAGSTASPLFLPNLQYPESNEVVEKAATAPIKTCTQLEKSAGLATEDCGLYSPKQLGKLIAKDEK